MKLGPDWSWKGWKCWKTDFLVKVKGVFLVKKNLSYVISSTKINYHLSLWLKNSQDYSRWLMTSTNIKLISIPRFLKMPFMCHLVVLVLSSRLLIRTASRWSSTWLISARTRMARMVLKSIRSQLGVSTMSALRPSSLMFGRCLVAMWSCSSTRLLCWDVSTKER